MCGIAGVISNKRSVDRDLLTAMRDAMSHRGPDDAGLVILENGRVGLAHRRLSIIDLSERAHQPMSDKNERLWVVFNGEIYNFRELRKELAGAGWNFLSESDTEVILAAYREWGVECVSRFNGMFAFAIYDLDEKRLMLARDRAGEKPLFYRADSNRIAFASELKSLMADPAFPRELDLDALDYYLAYGYVSDGLSIFRGTYKLPPGHVMLWGPDKDRPDIRRYWELPNASLERNASIEDLTCELEELLSTSVRRQLAADVPIGILLSGGIDSSLVTAIASKVSDRRIKTFTVSFPGHGSFDEAPYARLVADHFGTDHTELVAESTSVSLLPQLARQYDEPVADHSIVPTSMLTGLVRRSVTVALGGDGGDELFGGYTEYNFLQKIDWIKKCIPESFRRVSSAIASKAIPVGFKGRNRLIALEGGAATSISAINVYFDRGFRQKLLSPLRRAGHISSVSPESRKTSHFDSSLRIFQNATRIDFKTIMVDGYLVKTDRASMLHSLELRAPFLDFELVEFAFGRVPDNLRATLNERKILLKRLARRVLPKALDIKRKHGFALPLAAWFKGEWGSFMSEVLAEADPAIFDRSAIASLFQGQRNGLVNTNRLFALTMFELWRREYKITLPG